MADGIVCGSNIESPFGQAQVIPGAPFQHHLFVSQAPRFLSASLAGPALVELH